MLYIAYGSNMNIEQMAKRCPKAVPLCPMWLMGWRLVMRRVADVERCIGKRVPAALWKITKQCEEALDVYEGFPVVYKKQYLKTTAESGKLVRSMLYRMTTPSPPAPASDRYLQIIAEGYRDFGFSNISTLRDAQKQAISRVA